MNRRTAMLASGAIVLALLVAGVAATLGVTGPTADAGQVRARTQPRVRTTTETVTVHRPAAQPVALPGVATVVAQPVSAVPTQTDDDDAFEHEDDGYEDHDEDDGYGSEDQEDHEDDDHDDEHDDD